MSAELLFCVEELGRPRVHGATDAESKRDWPDIVFRIWNGDEIDPTLPLDLSGIDEDLRDQYHPEV